LDAVPTLTKQTASSSALSRNRVRKQGNARELRSYLEEAMVLSEAGILYVPESAARPDPQARPTIEGEAFVSLHVVVEEVERRHIRSALARTSGSVMKTAEILGISRKTLWEKMKRLKIKAAEEM
jgi:DNA-binding NtrC family response regulator